MKTLFPLSIAGLMCLLAVTTSTVVAQDDSKALNEIYKSRAEVINAEALNKQANASIINAHANYKKSHYESMKLHQETREKSAQNDLLETRVYYEKRALYHGYQDTHRAKPSAPEQYAARAAKFAPDRLPASQLWIKPGYLRWPSMLRHTDYASQRGQIDALFAARSPDDSGAGSQNCIDIQARLDELKAVLVANMKRYKSTDYLAARKYLDGLSIEAQHAVDSLGGQLASH